MKVTYICDRCGAIIGFLNLTENELQQIGIDLSAADSGDAIIKSVPTGGLFVYSLCDHCVDLVSICKDEGICFKKPGIP